MNIANTTATPVPNAGRPDGSPAVERVVLGADGDAVDTPTDTRATTGFGELLARRMSDVAADRMPVLADAAADSAAGPDAAPAGRRTRGLKDLADGLSSERGTATLSSKDGAPVVALDPTVKLDERSPGPLVDIPNAAGNDLAAQLAIVSQWGAPARPAATRTNDAASTDVPVAVSAASAVPVLSAASAVSAAPTGSAAPAVSAPSALAAAVSATSGTSAASSAAFRAAPSAAASPAPTAATPAARASLASAASAAFPAFPVATSVASEPSAVSSAAASPASAEAVASAALVATSPAAALAAPGAAVERDTPIALAARPMPAESALPDPAVMGRPPFTTAIGQAGPAAPAIATKGLAREAADAIPGVRETDGAVEDALVGHAVGEAHAQGEATGPSNALLQQVASQVASVQAPPPPLVTTTTLHETVGTPAWTHEVAEVTLRVAAGDLQSASLRLNPEHLGPLDVQVRIDAGVAHLTFAAAHADTRQALESSRVALDQLFAERGLKIGDCAIGDSSSSRRGFEADAGQSDGSPRGRTGGNGREPEADVASPTTAATTRLVRAPGMVDTFA